MHNFAVYQFNKLQIRYVAHALVNYPEFEKRLLMKITKNIITMLFSVLISSGLAVAQQNPAGVDTAKVRLQQREQQQEQARSEGQSAEQNRNQAQSQEGQGNQAQNQAAQGNQTGTQAQNQAAQGNQTGNQAQNQAATNRPASAQSQGANGSGVKKIQGARPDWSKARGARPASVERPSGSRVPKGAGKPGGAKGPGKR